MARTSMARMETATAPRWRAALRCSLVLVLASGAGCGIFESSTSQASVESSSNSSSSPFESSSKSSGGGGSSALARDVRVYSASHARAGGDATTLQREVGRIAQRYGVFDWEADPQVHRAMGRGFGQAGLDATAARRLGATVVGQDATRIDWMLSGLESVGPE